MAHLADNSEIIRHYQGIYSMKGSTVSEGDLIHKIMSRDRGNGYLIIPASKIGLLSPPLMENDYICLNNKRSGISDLKDFKILFQIPTHKFPRKITENFLLIHQMNTSKNLEETFKKIVKKTMDKDFLHDLKKYANKRTYKFISTIAKREDEEREISDGLVAIGAPFIRKTHELREGVSKEELLAKALKLGMDNPRIHNILPFTILKNKKEINFKKLEKLTKANGTYRYTGFILEILNKASGEDIATFRPPKYQKEPYILFGNILGKRGLERIKSAPANFALKNWGIIADINIESEKEKIRKWL